VKRTLVLIVLSLSVFCPGAGAREPEEVAGRLFLKLTGTPLALTDPRRQNMSVLVKSGKLEEAARIATADDAFYNLTIRHWGAPLTNRAKSPAVGLNDATAMIIGLARDQRDFREILSGDFTYASADVALTPYSDQHYNAIAELNLAKVLTRVEPQNADIGQAAGILTSRAWGEAHLQAGTNRRAIEFTFREFLCNPLHAMRDGTIPDSRVHRDVDRSPGGNSQTYLTTCRTCHAGIDALVGAYAYYRFDRTGPFGGGVVQSSKVQRKYNQNGEVYPEGYVTTDDSWINLFTENQKKQLQWRGQLSGKGIKEFGRMIADSGAFSKLSWNLEGLNEKFELEVERFDASSFRFRHPRLRSGERALEVRGIKVLVDDSADPAANAYLRVQNKIAPHSAPLLSIKHLLMPVSMAVAPTVRISFRHLVEIPSVDCSELGVFTKTALPVLEARCQSCHGKTQTSPFYLGKDSEEACRASRQWVSVANPLDSPLIAVPFLQAFPHPARVVTPDEARAIQDWMDAEVKSW
jgi:hypothetical protein